MTCGTFQIFMSQAPEGVRIRIYKDHGYFPPEQAQGLIDGCHDADVTIPGEILRRFVARFG